MTRRARSGPVQTVPDSYPRYESLVHMLAAAAAERPEQTAIICGDTTLDYADLGRAAAGLADRITESVGPGSLVAVMVPNSAETVVAVFGAMAAHCQAAQINPFYTERELDKVIGGIEPSIVVCVDATRDLAAGQAEKLGLPAPINLSESADGIPALVAAGGTGLSGRHMPRTDDLALLLFTGGTTGKPKGVNHHHRTLVWSTLLHCSVWPINPGREVVLNVAPLFHIWGLGYGVLVSVFAQSTFVLIPRYEPDVVLRAIEDHSVTIFGGGPAPIYAGLLASAIVGDVDFSSLRYCLSGGAPCPAELHRNWHKLTGCALFEGWGMTEGAPFCLNPADGVRKLMSVGRPVPETTIEVVDLETGSRVLDIGEAGEVRVRGPQVMSGYRNEPEETRIALRDGWLYTGDIGYIDEDGYLFLVDRKKDMVIVGGYNVYPREIDELLFQHPRILEASTVGRPDDRLGEVLVAFVAPRNGEELTEDDVLEYCRTNLVKYKRPVAVHFVDSLPRTAANKIDKISLRKQAAARGESR